MPKITPLDQRLIRELDANCRLSLAELSRRLRVPQATVGYRLTNLVERGFVPFMYTVVDAGKLGCTVYKVLLKFRNVDEARVKSIVEFLVKHESINWVARFDGIYDLSFTIWVSSVSQVSDFVDTLKGKFHAFISRLDVAVNIEAEFLTRDPVAHQPRKLEKKASYTTPKRHYVIDSTDLAILRIIGSAPRTSATEIAEQVKISSETVAQRIKNLEAAGVITGYRLVINSTLIGEMNFYVLVFLNFASPEKIKRFVDFCRAHPAVNYIIKALGEWDYELNLEVKDVLESRAFMMELTREFSEIVRDYQSLPVSDIHKFMIMPPGAVTK